MGFGKVWPVFVLGFGTTFGRMAANDFANAADASGLRCIPMSREATSTRLREWAGMLFPSAPI